MKISSKINNLNPYLDENGIIRVGGRLEKSNINSDCKHPILMPKNSHVSKLIILWCHQKTGHAGRGMTLNEVRSSGFWILNANSISRSLIFHCVTCRSLRGKLGEQLMSELPSDRLQECPPFTYCGVDLFGPFLIKNGRKEMKRYGVMFTCLCSRAVHIEVAHSLDTDSFILSLRRFIGSRGNIHLMRSDNGSNFVGAIKELREAFQEMNHNQIAQYLETHGADWITWIKNPPTASHMGGVWERQIRTTRCILNALLKTHGRSLNDEALHTLLIEVEAIVNSRPLTVETINDVGSYIPLSPSNLLTMKSKVVLPPPGSFTPADLYSRKRWRRVQHISNEFWTRWRKEFLHTLQERKKFSRKRRNLQKGDVILLKSDSNNRNEWSIARVTETFADSNGIIRTVRARIGDTTGDQREFVRPIAKIVLLLENDSPTESENE